MIGGQAAASRSRGEMLPRPAVGAGGSGALTEGAAGALVPDTVLAVKGLRVSAVVAVIVAIGAIPGVANATRPARLMPGLYSYPGGPQGSALVAFVVVKKRGREVVRNAVVACKSGSAPPAGIPSNYTLFLRIPRSVTITGRRTFAYSGPATIFPVGAIETSPPTTLVLEGRFVGVSRTRTAEYPTGFRGSFASSACASSSPVSFSFPFL